MASKTNRGTKRHCLNEDCKAPFYDLDRDPIVCPVCQTVFEPVAHVAFRPEAALISPAKPPRSSYGRRPPVTHEEAVPAAPDAVAAAVTGEDVSETELPAAEADTLLELEAEAEPGDIVVPVED